MHAACMCCTDAPEALLLLLCCQTPVHTPRRETRTAPPLSDARPLHALPRRRRPRGAARPHRHASRRRGDAVDRGRQHGRLRPGLHGHPGRLAVCTVQRARRPLRYTPLVPLPPRTEHSTLCIAFLSAPWQAGCAGWLGLADPRGLCFAVRARACRRHYSTSRTAAGRCTTP